jgi:hypothetical protein
VTRLVIAEIGTGTDIPSIRHISQLQGDGATLIRINPRESQLPLGMCGVSMALGGLAALEAIDLELNQLTP